MATVKRRGYGRALGHTLHGVLGRHVDTQRAMEDVAKRTARRANINLAHAPHGKGNSYAETGKGLVDHYVFLHDPEGPRNEYGEEGNAALQIEFIARAPLRRAAGIPVPPQRRRGS